MGGKKLQAGGPRASEAERKGALAEGRRGMVDDTIGSASLSSRSRRNERSLVVDVDGFGWWILTPALGVLERLWLAVVPLPQTPQASPGTVCVR